MPIVKGTELVAWLSTDQTRRKLADAIENALKPETDLTGSQDLFLPGGFLPNPAYNKNYGNPILTRPDPLRHIDERTGRAVEAGKADEQRPHAAADLTTALLDTLKTALTTFAQETEVQFNALENRHNELEARHNALRAEHDALKVAFDELAARHGGHVHTSLVIDWPGGLPVPHIITPLDILCLFPTSPPVAAD